MYDDDQPMPLMSDEFSIKDGEEQEDEFAEEKDDILEDEPKDFYDKDDEESDYMEALMRPNGEEEYAM